MSQETQLKKEEILRRMPQIKEIKDTQLREQVIQIFQNHCPEYFWKIPASSSGKYHPRDTRGKHGLWLHCMRAFEAFEGLSASYKEQGKITEQEQDYGRAAILLHDLFKQGLPPRDQHHSTDDHDKVCRNYLEQKTELPEPILECIDSHNGPWYEGKTPEIPLEEVHHLADMISSRPNAYFEINQNLPEELKIITGELNYD